MKQSGRSEPELDPPNPVQQQSLPRRLSLFFWEMFCKASTPPVYEAYWWGPRRSYMASLVYFLIFGLRLLPFLQWIKFRKRWGVHWRQLKIEPRTRVLMGHSTIEHKPRPDIHAADSEVYFLSVLAVAVAAFLCTSRFGFATWLAQHHLAWLVWAGRIAAVLLLIESIQWTFYYSVFRSLMERGRLNLYDEAEYFLMLPLSLGIQVFLLAILWHLDPVHVGLMLLNVGDPGRVPPPFEALSAAFLGQCYIVMILATLVRILPELHVRKRPIVSVIGCGDVVLERIIPALKQVYSPGQIAVAADNISHEAEERLKQLEIARSNCFSAQSPVNENLYGKSSPDFELGKITEKIVARVVSHSQFAIIAVPTPFHLEYMIALHREGIRFAVEKPLVGGEAELALIRQPPFAAVFENAFVLSYYWLEKALPLNYLLTSNPAYRLLLDFEPAVRTSEMELMVSRLGRLQSIAVEFLEGAEPFERSWSELQETGGMVMETLVHPLTLVLNVARRAADLDFASGIWEWRPTVVWRRDRERTEEVRRRLGQEIGATAITLEGQLRGGARVYIRCGKYSVNEPSRFMVAAYENGWITCDLSAMITRVLDRQERILLEIGNKSVLRSQKQRTISSKQHETAEEQPFKYQQQIDLVNTFFADGWGGLRFDDYPGQLTVLEELVRIAKKSPPAKAVREWERNFERDAPLLEQEMMLQPAMLAWPEVYED